MNPDGDKEEVEKLRARIIELEATVMEQGSIIVSTAIERDDARIRLSNAMKAAAHRGRTMDTGLTPWPSKDGRK